MRSRRLLASVAGVALVALLAALLLMRTERRWESVEPRPTGGMAEVSAPAGPDDLAAELDDSTETPRVALLAADPEKSPVAELATALVRARAVAREDHAPVRGVSFTALAPDVQTYAPSTKQRAAIGEQAVTGDDGSCELVVAADLEHRVFCSIPGMALLQERTVPALAPGEVHELVLEVPTQDDLDFHGVVLDDASGRPLAGALVAARESVLTDALGRFRLRARTWGPECARVSTPEHALKVVHVGPGHETAERALVVRLALPATLDVTVLAGLTPASGVRVRVRTSGGVSFRQDDELRHCPYPPDLREEWTGPDGRCLFQGLASRTPLEIEYGRAGEPTQSAQIKVAPGVVRDLELRIGAPVTLTGLAIDQHGQPIAGLVLLRAPSPPPSAESRRILEARTTTDARGGFEFADVVPGRWVIGPEPRPMTIPPDASEDGVASVGVLVTIVEGVTPEPLVLRFDRGLYLTGTVLDPDGAPARGAWVSALLRGPESRSVMEMADLAGAFCVGPLSAGLHEVRALSRDELVAPSLPVTAEAGESGLLLTLRAGCRIRGLVVGTDGEPRAGELHVALESAAGLEGVSFQETKDGMFEVDRLPPGLLTLRIQTVDGAFGQRAGLRLEPGETLAGLRIVATPGGRLRLRCADPTREIRCRLIAGAQDLGPVGASAGSTPEVPVPAGEIELHVTSPREETRTVRVAAGETVEVVLGE